MIAPIVIAVERRLARAWRQRIFYLLIAPFAALTIFLGVWPIVLSIQLAFTDSYTALSDAPRYVGIENFERIFADEEFIPSITNTVLFTAISVALNVSLALALALFLTNPHISRGATLFRLAAFLPVVTPDVATFIVWKWMFNQDYGAVNATLLALGLPTTSGITRPTSAFVILILVELWHNVGFYAIIFIANLQLLDPSLDEAARIDGANRLQRLRYVLLPQLRPAIAINSLYALIQFLKTFTVVMVITRGGPAYATNFLSYFAYAKFDLAQYGEAMAMATVLFAIVLGFSMVLHLINERNDHR